MRPLLSILLLLLSAAMYGQHDTTALMRLNAFRKNINAFDKLYTQEKVYLHLDNNGYLPGETIWFKAYVFRASTLLPTDLSKVLYVELLSPHGQVVERKTLPIINGRTYGDIKLDSAIYKSGFYEIRGYTRAMLNWDDSFIFSRTIPLYEEPTDTANFNNLTVSETEYKYNKPNNLVRTEPKPLISASTQKEGNAMLTFYPEGGNITAGFKSTVAYKLTDTDGLPLNDSIIIFDNNGKVITSSHTSHDGMGVFQLPATAQNGYAVTSTAPTAHFQLPMPRTIGADLHVTQHADSSITVSITASKELQHDTLGISLVCRSRLCHFQSLVPATDSVISIRPEQLGDGINQITLFTPHGEILSERLVWHSPTTSYPKMHISQNEDSYSPFSPVVLDISLEGADNKPLQGDFSLSVRDAGTETAPDYHSLKTDMLLASELKGYIHQPEYYFADNDPKRMHDLDLLLMVQGWRRYSWKQMSWTEPLQLKQPVENGLLLFGDVTKTAAVKNILKKGETLSVNFLLNTAEGTKVYSANTDNNGRYALELPEFYGDAPSIITVTNNKDKRVYTNLRIQRNFSPSPKPYEPWAIAGGVPQEQVRANAIAKPATTFEWKDTIPDVIGKLIKLGDVSIKGQKATFGYDPNSGIKKGAAEIKAKQGATYYYNIPAELDKYLDQGNSIPNLYEWLATVNPSFEYFPSDKSTFYNGRKLLTFANIDKIQEGRRIQLDPTLSMHSFRSLVIVEDINTANNIVKKTIGPLYDERKNVFGELTNSSYNAIAFLFSRETEDEIEYYKKGTRNATIHGYSRCDEFYSPDYRLKDIPQPSDHRRTLYWNPSLVTDETGKASVTLYSNSHHDMRLHINAEGIAVNGQMFEYR